MGIAKELAGRIGAFSYDVLPDEAVLWAKTAILDTVGVTLAGSGEECVRILESVHGIGDGGGPCLVFGRAARTGPLDAGLINGTASHALDFDDMAPSIGGHPSVPLVPAIIAFGEMTGASGKDVLTAYVAGFETESRIARAVNFHHYEKGWHPTTTLGIFGTVAASALLLGLSEDETETALALAVSLASGVKANFGTMTKPLHAGLTCRDGVTAAQLAQRGLTAGEQIIEHPFGFATTVLGEGIYDLDEMAENLGKPYRVQDALMIKKYPCCGGNHAMLDSLFSLMRDNDFTYEDVASAEVDQSYYSVVMLYQDPDDELKGKFSAKFNVAAALVDGEIAIDTFTQEKIADPTINETMGKVRTRVMAKSEEMLTRSDDGHKIKITLKDGRVFEHVTARADILGSQKNPWGFENIKAKFQENVALVLSQEGVEDAVNAWSDILQVTDVSGTVARTLS